MFMNLHSLPTGQDMFTLFLVHKDADPKEYCSEEVDKIAPRYWSHDAIIESAQEEIDDLYGKGEWKVIAVANQSDGFMLWVDSTFVKSTS